jgi:hypothetical protein
MEMLSREMKEERRREDRDGFEVAQCQGKTRALRSKMKTQGRDKLGRESTRWVQTLGQVLEGINQLARDSRLAKF